MAGPAMADSTDDLVAEFVTGARELIQAAAEDLLALDGAPGIAALSADTDGTDGGRGEATDPAGAMIDPTTLARAAAAGLDAGASLGENDSTPFFDRIGDLVRPGPTRTNVNDLRIILVG